jgi:3-oxoacyl-[acyl-carrier protein] reductase
MDPPFYSACTGPAKAAENHFTKALAMEFGPANIRVNAVAPGRINAPERFEMWRESIAGGVGEAVQASDLQQKWGQRIVLPDHRWGEVEEIANLVTFAASPVCGFATGAIFVADGGESHN